VFRFASYCFISLFIYSYANCTCAKEILLDIDFSSRPYAPFYTEAVHIKRVMHIDNVLNTNHVVYAKTRITHNLPITLSLLVKPFELNQAQINLHFTLVQYGYNKPNQALLSPKLILNNHETGEVHTPLFDLKVLAVWSMA
jgi:hypothetical protein